LEIRFSLVSLFCLICCWLGISFFAFYLGTLMGRMQQRKEIQLSYRGSERTGAQDEFPSLSFPEVLTQPDASQEGPSAVGIQDRPGARSAAGPTDTSDGDDETEERQERLALSESPTRRVLQIASFREPDRADRLEQVLREKGYPCFQSASVTTNAEKGFFRVFVGPLPDQETAVRVKAKLEEQEGYRDILMRAGSEKGAPF
jgi:hypothetical protein